MTTIYPLRENLIKKLRQEGKTYLEIADMVGISHQRVHQIDNRTKYTPSWRKETIKKEKYFFCDDIKDKMHIHHIDKNHKHNTSENLLLLCPTCHRQIHAKNIDVRIKKYQNKNLFFPWQVLWLY